MCSGKASGAFGLDHVFQTASAQSKCDVWAAKRGMAWSAAQGRKCSVWDVEVKEEPWQGHHTMQRVRKQQPSDVRTIPPATSSNPLYFASSSEYQPPLFSCVASMLTSGS